MLFWSLTSEVTRSMGQSVSQILGQSDIESMGQNSEALHFPHSIRLVRELKEVPRKNPDTPLEICMFACFRAEYNSKLRLSESKSDPFKNQFFHVFFRKALLLLN